MTTENHDSPNILIVEDYHAQRVVFQAICEKFGFAASFVNSGEKAIEVLQANQINFDAIIMDWKLGGISGGECAKLIRSLEAPFGKHTPILVVSACAMVGDRERFLAAGADDYLAKPFTSDDFRNLILRWTSQANHPDKKSLTANPRNIKV